MWKSSLTVATALLLSACASNQDRLMDAQVRPGEHADCLVGGSTSEAERLSGSPSARAKRCEPESSIGWSSESRKNTMEVDFKNKHD